MSLLIHYIREENPPDHFVSQESQRGYHLLKQQGVTGERDKDFMKSLVVAPL